MLSRVSRVFVAVVLVLGAVCMALAQDPAASQKGSLKIEVSGIRSDKGKILCGLYNKADGFPMNPQGAFQNAMATPKDGKATLEFKDLPAGDYAYVMFHDENNNGQVDMADSGIPAEGVGVSNYPEINSMPEFDTAKFSIKGTSVVQKITILYF